MDNSSCIFCKIIKHQQPAEILYEDEEVLVIKDIKPVSKHHYLAIPKKHIKAANLLTSADLPLLHKLIEMGKRVLSDNNGDVNEARLGFHWPPFYSISHLHLHIISPVSEMGFFARQIYKPDTFWFVSKDYMLKRLEQSNL